MVQTRLRPEHFGEPLIREILHRIAEKNMLGIVPCYSLTNKQPSTLVETMQALGLLSTVRFHENVSLAPIECSEGTFKFDGFSRIDCLIEDGQRAIGIEVKLGTQRLSASDIQSRFLKDCSWSKHIPPKIKGNMIAILDGRFCQPELASVSLKAEVAADNVVPLLKTWFLLLRRQVWRRLQVNPPSIQRTCHVLILEDLVPMIGGPIGFDEIVRHLVGDEFAISWKLHQ